MAEETGALTAAERGDTHPAIRGIARVIIVVAVAVLVAGVVLAGNFVHTGTFFPWLQSGTPGTAVVAPVPTPDATDAPETPKTPAELVAAEDARLAAVAALAPDDPALLEQWNTVVLAPRGGQQTGYGLSDLLASGARGRTTPRPSLSCATSSCVPGPSSTSAARERRCGCRVRRRGR